MAARKSKAWRGLHLHDESSVLAGSSKLVVVTGIDASRVVSAGASDCRVGEGVWVSPLLSSLVADWSIAEVPAAAVGSGVYDGLELSCGVSEMGAVMLLLPVPCAVSVLPSSPWEPVPDLVAALPGQLPEPAVSANETGNAGESTSPEPEPDRVAWSDDVLVLPSGPAELLLSLASASP